MDALYAFLKKRLGLLDGVCVTGGEPLLQPDLCTELAVLLKERGINIAVDTSLYVPTEALEKILPYTDTFLAR